VDIVDSVEKNIKSTTTICDLKRINNWKKKRGAELTTRALILED
jgi:hypothetical protein